jgi:FtsH-binding integral membrane protein
MYSAALIAHSWLRWVVILAGLVAVGRSVLALSRNGRWTPADDRAGFWFVTTVDLQWLVGLMLYFFLSPYTGQALHDFGGAMKDPVLRFWAVEHAFGMLIAAVLVHVGRVRTRKTDSLRRHRVAAIFFGLALVLILMSIPWPGSAHGRPLLRW